MFGGSPRCLYMLRCVTMFPDVLKRNLHDCIYFGLGSVVFQFGFRWPLA